MVWKLVNTMSNPLTWNLEVKKMLPFVSVPAALAGGPSAQTRTFGVRPPAAQGRSLVCFEAACKQ